MKYYLNFDVQFGDGNNLTEVISVGRRLITRLTNLVKHRLANTKLKAVAQGGMEAFCLHENVRINTKRMQDIHRNFTAEKTVMRSVSTFVITHKFFTKEKVWEYDTKTTGNTFRTTGKQVLNFLQYGRRGSYFIPKVQPTPDSPIMLAWSYGSGKGTAVFRFIPPQKRVYVRRRKNWKDGLFDLVDLSIQNFVSDTRDEIAAIIRSEGAKLK